MSAKDTFPELADLADALTACPARIKSDRGLSFTTYEITGDLQGVLTMVRLCFEDWSPFGYGTKVQEIKMLDDGLYYAKVWRSNSAD